MRKHRNRSGSGQRVREIKFSGAPADTELTSLRTELLTALRDHDGVTINCADVTSANIGLIQLILATRKAADTANKKLSLAHPASGPVLTALRQAGFVGAPHDAFWLRAKALSGNADAGFS